MWIKRKLNENNELFSFFSSAVPFTHHGHGGSHEIGDWGSTLKDGQSLRKHAHAIYRFKCKNENFHWKNFDIFLIFAQNMDCGYMLEPPRRGSSNEYPQSMFWSKNKKNRYTPANPSFST